MSDHANLLNIIIWVRAILNSYKYDKIIAQLVQEFKKE